MDEMLKTLKGMEFNLDHLVLTARALIEMSNLAPLDGRVAEFPDARTVRYYQTMGLIMKPTRYDGRNAVYGYEHLRQLVVLKLLQARGLSLTQIQRTLMQASSIELETALMEAVQTGASLIDVQSPELQEKIDEVERGIASLRERRKPASVSEVPRRVPMERLSRNLFAAEISPGVSVMIDPKIVEDPDAVITHIARNLKNAIGGKE
jgi:DNA-binding transcriptional MerR regulator